MNSLSVFLKNGTLVYRAPDNQYLKQFVFTNERFGRQRMNDKREAGCLAARRQRELMGKCFLYRAQLVKGESHMFVLYLQ